MSSEILVGDALETLKTMDAESVQCCVTSPPYFGLRDYGIAGQLGLEKTPAEYVEKMVAVFREVGRVLRNDGTLWLNIGDSYAGSGKGAPSDGVVRLTEKSAKQITSAGTTEGVFHKTESGCKPKDLIGIPWMLAFALRADGWYLRQDIIWHKPNPMPESVTDRCTKAHEYVFLLTKSSRYYYDSEAVSEPLSESTLSDPRLRDEEYETGRPDRGFTGAASKGAGLLKPRFGGTKYGDNTAPAHRPMSGNEYTPSGKRNKRSVWTITTTPYKEAHFATMPPKLVEPCIKAGTKIGDVVLDPFSGAGTVGLVASKNPQRCPSILGRCRVTFVFRGSR